MRALKCLGHNDRFLCWTAEFPNASQLDPYHTFLSRRQWKGPRMNKRTDEKCAVIKRPKRRPGKCPDPHRKTNSEVGREVRFIFSVLFIAPTQNCFPWKMNGVLGEAAWPCSLAFSLHPAAMLMSYFSQSPYQPGRHQYPCFRGTA